MLLAEVVAVSQRVAETSKRLEKTARLAALLARLPPSEIEVATAFLSGRTLQGKAGIGYRTLQQALSTPAQTPSLEMGQVNRILHSLAAIRGPGAANRRQAELHALLSTATAPEQRFLSSLLMGELRQGALEGIMADAVAGASKLPVERVRRAAMLAGDIVPVARAAIEEGSAGLARFDVQLFRPVLPMLALAAEDIAEPLAEFGQTALEFKMDGARVQAHRDGSDVRIFTRQLNDVTAAVPEIVEAVQALPAGNLILDGEVLALAADSRPQPFQLTMRRFGRKLDVRQLRRQLPLTPFWFDLLYLDGRPLLDEKQSRRFAALSELSPPDLLIPHTLTADPSAAAGFLNRALDQGHEGIMAKAPDSLYAAGARGHTWRKVKQAHTLDLVILAAEWGHGRRRGLLSNLHLGARDPSTQAFVMLGKTFKGLTDEMLAWQTRELLALQIARDEYTVYVQPKLVAEIAFNEVQASPRYPGGMALRFARVKRYRPDKSPSEADTVETVRRFLPHPPIT
ncbi:MAG: ATP-dependent DNA ligase [Bryobacterales bacterium]|nr:ATP-dependent DNA ligase [Bryobacterales bacterium]